MAKRKITVTVDDDLVEFVRGESDESMSAVVNAALASHVDKLRRRAALAALLAGWDETLGPVSAEDAAAAAAAFDDLDAGTAPPGHSITAA